MDKDTAAQDFLETVRQYQQRIGTETASYLVETYQLGSPDIAFVGLVSCLIDLGYNEDDLLHGPLQQLAQLLNINTTWSAEPDRSKIAMATAERPDPFAPKENPVKPEGTPELITAEVGAPAQPLQPGQSVQPQVQPQDDEGTLRIR